MSIIVIALAVLALGLIMLGTGGIFIIGVWERKAFIYDWFDSPVLPVIIGIVLIGGGLLIWIPLLGLLLLSL